MSVNWLKTGAESAQMAAAHQQKVELEKATRPSLFRYYLKDGETDAFITFVDGDLITVPGLGQQVLAPPRVYEHNLKINGKFGNHYVCPQHTLPQAGYKCPICEAGDQPPLIAALTIIDHREIPSADGKKLYKDMKRLFIAKPATMEQLQVLAVTHGGLAGCTFKVSRVGDNAAAVGNIFEFVEKNPVAALQSMFVQEVEKDGKKVTETYFTPADYARELPLLLPDDLNKLGVAAYVSSSRYGGGGHSSSGLKPGGQGGGFMANKFGGGGSKPAAGMDFSKEM